MKTLYFISTLKLGLLWALLAALPCVQTLMAQYSNRNIIITPSQKLSEGEEDNEIVINTNSNERPVSIEFVCKTSGDVCSRFDVQANCPFEKLPFPILERKSNTNPFKRYNLEKVSSKQIVELLLPNLPFENIDTCKMYSTSTRYGVRKSESGNYVIVFYTLVFFGEGGGAVAANTYLLKFNNKGERIFAMKNMNGGLGDLILTDDGRYLAYGYGGFGGPHGDCVVGSIPAYDGINIIDTHLGLVVFNQLEHHKMVLPAMTMHRKLILSNQLKATLQKDLYIEYIAFDFSQNKLYRKKFLWEERVRLKDITATGFVFRHPTIKNKEVIYLYEKDFNQEPLKH
ncbi:MAG TPA: hypothetical protein PK239_18755 [Chitinophagales bacterium]|nr:hypothetical protein [Chitinophagales bacterium]